MAQPSFPLIGIDRNGNEHPFEHPGPNAIEAAKRGAELKNYTKVLYGNERTQRHNTTGLFYRKVLFQSPSTNNELTVLGEQLVLALNNGPNVIKYARQHGIDLPIKTNGSGERRVTIQRTNKCTLPIQDSAALWDAIKLHHSSVLACLDKELPPESSEAAVLNANRGKTNREVMLSTLPQMPSPFSLEDFIRKLADTGYTEFAKKRLSAQSGLGYCVTKGELEKKGRQYFITQKFRDRNKKPALEAPTPITVAEVVEQPPVTVAETLIQRQNGALAGESTAEIRTPEAIESEKQSPTPPAQTAATQANEVNSAASTGVRKSTDPVTERILDFLSQSTTSPQDVEQLLTRYTEAQEHYHTAVLEAQTLVLEAGAKLTEAWKPINDLLLWQKGARQTFAQLLMAGMPDGRQPTV